MGRFFSRAPESTTIPHYCSTSPAAVTTLDNTCDSSMDDDSKFCYCQGSKDGGEMVGCDNRKCIYKWYHLECLNLKAPPKSKMWYCPDCQRLPQFQRKIKRKK
jgi:chromatin modification-related protein YNG2